jgi:mediator of RNA polymerase II transcription subunit 17
MGSLPQDFPISLQPWSSKNNDHARVLPAFFQRVYVERGGLRNVTEESLREEIAEEEAAAAAGEGDGADEEAVEEEPDRAKELMTARADMLDHIQYVWDL